MKLQIVISCLIISFLIANSESLKVLFAKNTTAHALREAEADRVAKQPGEAHVHEGTVLIIPNNCKPGFVFESTFHHRCRKISG